MNITELKETFFELQSQYKQFIDVLMEKQELYRTKYDFRGIEASPSPLIPTRLAVLTNSRLVAIRSGSVQPTRTVRW